MIACPAVADVRLRSKLFAHARRWAPWLIGIVIIAVLIKRIPLAAFRGAIGHGPHLLLASVDLGVMIATLCSDSLATWIGLIELKMRRPFKHVIVVRGATYLLVLLNYAVGQGGFGYYLHRSGATPMRATGATLFLIGTNLAALLVATPASWLLLGVAPLNNTMWWTVVIGCSGLGLYLVVIQIAPAVLQRRQLFEPLFAAGVRGHVVSILGRVPHVAMIVFGQWVALRAWGIEVPLVVAATVMPAVAIASSLPISPGGLGTSQAALVYFFADYAVGTTSDDRTATVLAFSIAHFVYSMLASVVVGIGCAPFAKRVTPPVSEPEPG